MGGGSGGVNTVRPGGLWHCALCAILLLFVLAAHAAQRDFQTGCEVVGRQAGTGTGPCMDRGRGVHAKN